MSGKLSEVEGRIGTVHQLQAVITAMRGSAAARSREARSRLDGIRAYAAAIGAAIGQALALAPEPEPQPRRGEHEEGHVVVVLCAEQGFAGTFNERVLDAAENHLKSAAAELLVVGDRGAMVAAERGLAVRLVGTDGGPRRGGADAGQSDHRRTLLASRKGPGDASDGGARRARAFGLDRNRRTGVAAVRLRALQGDTAHSPSDYDAPPGAAPCRARRGVRLRPAVRGGDAVLRRRKRGTHAGDDRRPQQCQSQARRARRELPPPAPGGDHGRDHRALGRQHIGRDLRQS